MSVKKKVATTKFSFSPEFQEHILVYLLTFPGSYKVVPLVNPDYFELLEHQVISTCINKHYKAKKQIPDGVILSELVRELFSTKQFAKLVDAELKLAVDRTIANIYKVNLKDPKYFLDKIISFAKYVELKNQIESIDLLDFQAYETISPKISSILSIGREVTEEKGLFLISGIRDIHIDRKNREDIVTFPIKQLNKLTNSGGFTKGSVICFMGRAKRFKSGLLINLARLYAKRGKRVIYFDFENGREMLATRAEQSFAMLTQEEVMSGEHDAKVEKLMRRYRRLRAEVVIERMPARATVGDMKNKILRYKQEYGLTFEVCVVDYAALMGSMSNSNEEFHRISDAYMDLKGFASTEDFDVVLTANHVVREAAKRREATRYDSDDLAKCIDIHRHVDALIGLQEDDDEKAGGVLRLEIIDQRNGQRSGRALLWVDYPKQYVKEFTEKELEDYIAQRGAYEEHGDGEYTPAKPDIKPEDKKEGKKEKRVKTKSTGDL